MEEMKELGNIEFLNCMITLQYMTFDYSEEIDRRIFEPYGKSKEFLSKILHLPIEEFAFYESNTQTPKEERITKIYDIFLEEALKRGLSIDEKVEKRDIIYTRNFDHWMKNMRNHPTYIREIYATNYLGASDIGYVDNEFIGFDYPVRKACKLLNEKGYQTYWSSANIEDAKRREGHVVKDKSVAYILIDSRNLNSFLKEKLFLNGDCDFWGIAESYHDQGKYYGVWQEITDINMECEVLSSELLEKTSHLPNIAITKKY